MILARAEEGITLILEQRCLYFCKNHQLKIEDSLIVNSLVKNHLLMSQVSQKQNIDDPEVVSSFIKVINSQDLLDYLYLLTVADIRATREDLWNDWKDALLKKLYMNASKALENDNFEQDLTSFKSKDVHEKLIHHCISYGIDLMRPLQLLKLCQQNILLDMTLMTLNGTWSY